MAVNQNIQVSTQRQKELWSGFRCPCLGAAGRSAGPARGHQGLGPARHAQLQPAPADPPQGKAGPASQDGGASMKEGYSRAEKAAGKEERRTKGVRNCPGNTKVREEEEK